jgi:hypothetical protein
MLREARSDDVVDTGEQIDQPVQWHPIRFRVCENSGANDLPPATHA